MLPYFGSANIGDESELRKLKKEIYTNDKRLKIFAEAVLLILTKEILGLRY